MSLPPRSFLARHITALKSSPRNAQRLRGFHTYGKIGPIGCCVYTLPPYIRVPAKGYRATGNMAQSQEPESFAQFDRRAHASWAAW